MIIKSLLKSIIALFFTINALGQSYSITGLLVDENSNPISFANIALYEQADSLLVKGDVSDDSGKFLIQADAGNYYIRITFISFQEKIIPSVRISNKPIQLGKIILSENTDLLSEVVVLGEKSQMELSLDKRVFNVEKDLSNIGRNVSEILDNVPSVTVDVDGNVSLRGSENVRILINGKPSGLAGISSTDALRQLQGNMIESVEVITNPSARFDAEGEVGIINIILKKNIKQGLNGSFTGTAGYPDNYVSSFNLNFRKGNVNLNGSYALNYRASPGSGKSSQQYFSPDTSFVYDQTQKRERSGFSHNFMFGAEYSLTDKSSLTGAIAYRRSDGLNTSEITYQDFDSNGDLVKTVIRDEREKEPEENIDASLSFRKDLDRKGQTLTIDAKLIRSDELELTEYNQSDDTGSDLIQQRGTNTENESNQLVQMDYIHPFGEKGKLEFGGKTATRIIENKFLLEQLDESSWATLPSFNNNLIYTERMHALYAIIGNSINRYSFQLGVRGEFSDITTELTVTDNINNRTYFNLFPSAHFSYQVSDPASVQFSYSYRISRPRIRDLMPFSNFTDSRVFFSGNPNLNPEYTHSFEGGYLLNWENASLLTSAYYRHRLGVVQRITQVDDEGLTRIFPVNLATENAVGLEFNLSYSLQDWWRLNTNGNFYRAITNGIFEEQTFYSDTYTWTSRLTSRITFLKKNNFQTSFNYRAPRITTQGKDLSIYSLDLGYSKDLLKGKGTLTASVQDVFNSRKRRRIIDSDGYYSTSEFQWRARQFLLTFTYRLNQKKVDRESDENSLDGDY